MRPLGQYRRPDADQYVGGDGPRRGAIMRLLLIAVAAVVLAGCATAQLPVCPEITLKFCPVG